MSSGLFAISTIRKRPPHFSHFKMSTANTAGVVGYISALIFSLAGLVAEGQDRPGIVVERIQLPRRSELAIGDAVATIVRVDLRRYRFTFLTQRDGAARPLDRWVREHHLAGAINAGMFLHGGRPCGFVQLRGTVLNDRRPARFQSVVAFDPIGQAASFAVGGTGCGADLDETRRHFGSLLQGTRALVDCHGTPTNWRTGRYSSASLGVDGEGRAVLVHVRTPYRMNVLARMLAAPELGIRGLVFMEGGPEASLIVNAEGQRVALMGSWEDGFHEADDLHELWDLPNVVGFESR